jgi:hypothetical protein
MATSFTASARLVAEREVRSFVRLLPTLNEIFKEVI